MADFNIIKKSAKKCLDKAVVSANNVLETTKKYAEKTQVSQKLSSMYERLGKAYYMQETGKKDESMIIKMLLKQIKETQAELSDVQKELDDCKSKKCSACGRKNPPNSKFCIECGNKLDSE